MAERTLDANAQEKVSNAIALFRKTYYANSEIGKIVNTRDATSDEEGFLQLGSKYYIPKDWFTREDIVFDIAIEQFAENLVLSETKYILSRIVDCEQIQRAATQQNILDSFVEQFRRFSETTKIQAIFAPIDLLCENAHRVACGF